MVFFFPAPRQGYVESSSYNGFSQSWCNPSIKAWIRSDRPGLVSMARHARRFVMTTHDLVAHITTLRRTARSPNRASFLWTPSCYLGRAGHVPKSHLTEQLSATYHPDAPFSAHRFVSLRSVLPFLHPRTHNRTPSSRTYAFIILPNLTETGRNSSLFPFARSRGFFLYLHLCR